MKRAVVGISLAGLIAVVGAAIYRISANAEPETAPSAANVASACRSASAKRVDSTSLAIPRTICGMPQELLLDPETAFATGDIRDRRELDWFVEVRTKCLPADFDVTRVTDRWAQQTADDSMSTSTPYYVSLRRFLLAHCVNRGIE